MTSQIGSSGRLLDCLLALLSVKGASDNELEPLRKFAGKVAGKQRLRNRIVHDPWYFDFNGEDTPPKPSRIEVSAAKKPVFGHVPYATEDVDKFIDDIILLKNALRRIMAAIQISASQ